MTFDGLVNNMADEFVHLEHDGKLLLVDEQGKGPQLPIKGRTTVEDTIRLPTVSEVSQLEIDWSEKRRSVLQLGDSTTTVIKGHPNIEWPKHWAWKDDVISDSSVDPIARESVYRSLHRLVAKLVVINEENKVLMAKVKRGHFVDSWTLPGGYLDHDEHPRKGAVREALEELGIELTISENADSIISQNIFTQEGISFISLTYRVDVLGSEIEFKLKDDEISDVDWFSREQALGQAVSWFDTTAISQLLK